MLERVGGCTAGRGGLYVVPESFHMPTRISPRGMNRDTLSLSLYLSLSLPSEWMTTEKKSNFTKENIIYFPM